MPIVFILHVIEEASGFVAWFNSLVARHISQQLFLTVNATALVITVFVAIVVAAGRESVSALVGVGWVGFLMLANGIFHLAGTFALGRYCPGVITGTLLYLPLSLLFMRTVVLELALPPRVVLAVALLGGIPMYIHGYLIVFRGSRLF